MKTRGSLQKRPGGWCVQWMHDGVRHFAPVENEQGERPKDKKEARAMSDAMLRPFTLQSSAERAAALAARADTIRAAAAALNPPPRLVEAWGLFAAMNPGRRRTLRGREIKANTDTLLLYEGYAAAMVRWMTRNYPDAQRISDVTGEMADAYMGQLEKAGTCPGTRNKHRDFLQTLWHVIAPGAPNPWQGISRGEADQETRRVLTLAELRTLLASATGELRPMFFLGTFTGLRWGDVCTLRWGEVDLDAKVIRRIPNKVKRRGRNALVRVGIPPVLEQVLREHRTAGEYVMPDAAQAYGKPTARAQLSRKVMAHFRACGIRTTREGTGTVMVAGETGKARRKHTGKRAVVEVGFHSLRHTYVTLHAERGTPAAMIQKNVGHANPAMTEHYLHVQDDAARKMALALPDPLATEQKPSAIADRAPLPGWAREIVQGMTAKNWKAARAALLK